jgi:hypothetical protein
LANIDTTVVTVLGALMCGKVIQSYSANDAAPTKTVTSTPTGATTTVTPVSTPA